MNRTLLGVVVLVSMGLLAGCATTRSEIKLTAPMVASGLVAKHASKDQIVLVRSVVDERQFEAAPKDPSIPSLGFEGAAQATMETKARAFGRKRNGFGRAMGDVLLDKSQSVTGVVREQLNAAFADAGYRVAQNEVDAGASPVLVDVRIKQFWSWINMGFWALTLNNQITTDLTFSGAAQPMAVSVHLQEQHMAVTDSAWTEDLGKALQAYRTQVVDKLGKLSLTP
ncbi:MAG: hypothetical protein P4L87_09770 [Formivibrio sp.]|nr:hypothetical protein [Formivibrio sp.]